MNGSMAIVDKIISDAKNVEIKNLSDAKIKADAILAEADVAISAYISKIEADTKLEAKLIVERRETVAKLDVKKAMLKGRQEVLDECFFKAKSVILNDSKLYKEFFFRIMSQYAEDKDEVILSKSEKIIDDKMVAQIAEKCKISLKISKIVGNFEGGVIIRSKSFDKNLTLDTIIRETKEDALIETSVMLFGKEA